MAKTLVKKGVNNLSITTYKVVREFCIADAERMNEIGKCCVCQKQLKRFEGIHSVSLEQKASWPFPVVGNPLSGEDGNAVAFVCDECLEDADGYRSKIKFAVEMCGDEIIYHRLDELTN